MSATAKTRLTAAARRRAGHLWTAFLAGAAAILFLVGLAAGHWAGERSAPPADIIRLVPPEVVAPTAPQQDRQAARRDREPEAPPAVGPPNRFLTVAAAGPPPAPFDPPAAPPAEPAAVPAEPPATARTAPDDEAPAWQRHAVPSDPPPGRPMLAVVIDDLGVNRKGTRAATALPGPLTMAFLTYADDLDAQTAAARAAGHELLLHLPMEPVVAGADPGPNALLRSLDPAEIARRLAWGLDRFDGYVGLNNHMGSAFTTDAEGMAIVLRELKRRGLMFLDSRTTADTAAPDLARTLGVPFAERDVFLDNEPSEAAVAAQLAALEATARARGAAIGIGHPHPATVAALRAWLPGLADRGVALVPVSAVLRAQVRPAVMSGRPPGTGEASDD